MKSCLPLPPSDDRALMVAAKRVRAPVLEDMRPSAGALFVARRLLPAAVPGDVDNPSRGVAPLEPLSGAVLLLGLWSALPAPALRLSIRGGLSSRGVLPCNRANFQLIDDFLTSPLTCFFLGGGWGRAFLRQGTRCRARW